MEHCYLRLMTNLGNHYQFSLLLNIDYLFIRCSVILVYLTPIASRTSYLPTHPNPHSYLPFLIRKTNWYLKKKGKK